MAGGRRHDVADRVPQMVHHRQKNAGRRTQAGGRRHDAADRVPQMVHRRQKNVARRTQAGHRRQYAADWRNVKLWNTGSNMTRWEK